MRKIELCCLLAFLISPVTPANDSTQALSTVLEKIKPMSLAEHCKRVSNSEPSYELSYRVEQQGEIVTKTAAIYGDLCNHITAQPTSHIISYTDTHDRELIIGFIGMNDSLDSEISFPVFTRFMMK